ncbi:hypothetical protein [Teredinibacter sp. KSP-S5-2]|uniref:hypothetical protein n=1 Tax=Teredinibacter sp. KSP-S5-2 TaxID=3034506 RepID=UPI002934AD4B|nr:hypothetical protein [Teredinibacter sp. KSP-S5-2]WNO07629.1 hypothetical protein P5V12_11570 [Teredinibacter sp. KSP-S5-2]
MRKMFVFFLAFLFVFSYSAVASEYDENALAADQLKVAERKASMFAAKVKLAKDFFDKNNLSMTQKRLNEASGSYEQIAEPYRLHPQVVADKSSFDTLTEALAKANAIEDADKNKDQYIKKVDDAEKYLKRRDVKTAKARLSSALDVYGELPESYKVKEEVVAAKSKYETLINEVGAPEEKKTTESGSTTADSSTETYGLDRAELTKAKNSASRFKKNLNSMVFYHEKKNYKTAYPLVAKGNKEYNKIPEAYRVEPGLVADKKLFDEISELATNFYIADGKAREKSQMEFELRSGFDSSIRKLGSFLPYLKDGKEQTFDGYLYELERFLLNYEAGSEHAVKLLEKYEEHLGDEGIIKAEGYSNAEIIDLIKNRDVYRNAAVKKAIEKDLASVIKSQEKILKDLDERRIAFNVDLVKLEEKDYKMSLNGVKDIIEVSETLGIPLPEETFKELNAYKGKIIAHLEEAADKGEFDESEYSETSKDMKLSAEKIGKERGYALIYAGVNEDEKWTIVKNALGIPTHKFIRGKALYHKEGEDFYRAMDATFNAQFNGTGYEPVSWVRLESRITIYER